LEFAAWYNLPAVGGSDAHYPNEIGLGGIIVDSGDIRNAIMQNNVTVFGKRSPMLNHVRTKILETARHYMDRGGNNESYM
jgi:hypothetical protein